MKNKKFISKITKGVIEQSIKGNANNTTCGVLYQPKAPKNLSKFSKIKNDK